MVAHIVIQYTPASSSCAPSPTRCTAAPTIRRRGGGRIAIAAGYIELCPQRADGTTPPWDLAPVRQRQRVEEGGDHGCIGRRWRRLDESDRAVVRGRRRREYFRQGRPPEAACTAVDCSGACTWWRTLPSAAAAAAACTCSRGCFWCWRPRRRSALARSARRRCSGHRRPQPPRTPVAGVAGSGGAGARGVPVPAVAAATAPTSAAQACCSRWRRQPPPRTPAAGVAESGGVGAHRVREPAPRRPHYCWRHKCAAAVGVGHRHRVHVWLVLLGEAARGPAACRYARLPRRPHQRRWSKRATVGHCGRRLGGVTLGGGGRVDVCDG